MPAVANRLCPVRPGAENGKMGNDLGRARTVPCTRITTTVVLVIVQAGQPVAEVKPIVSGGKALRPFGLCAGEFIVPDDFDAPLPEDILKAFEGQ